MTYVLKRKPHWPLALALLLLTWAALSVSAATPKRVLMVFREANHVPANVLIEQAVRAELQTDGDADVEIYAEYLDASHFTGETHYRLLQGYLREKYRDRPLDVILTTMTSRVSGFSVLELMPGTPVVFISVPSATSSVQSLGTNVTGITAGLDYRGTVDLIFRLQPDTRRIVVIGDVGSQQQDVRNQLNPISQMLSNRASFEFWTQQPMTDLQAAVSRLPTGTVVLYTWIFRDASGRVFVPAQALEMILAHASVPVYVLVDSQLGSGAVGGSLVSYERLGAWAGKTTHGILDGTNAASLPITVLTNGTPMFDWRALRRWGLKENRLPAGSVVEFRQQDFWQLYRWWIIGGVLASGLQTALIIGLIIHRTRRRQAEAAALLIADFSSKFINLPSNQMERAIEDAQRQICTGLGLDISALWQASAKDANEFTLTHLHRAPGGPPIAEPMNAQEYFPWALNEVRAGRIVRLDSVEAAPAAAARDLEMWRHFKVRSLNSRSKILTTAR